MRVWEKREGERKEMSEPQRREMVTMAKNTRQSGQGRAEQNRPGHRAKHSLRDRRALSALFLHLAESEGQKRNVVAFTTASIRKLITNYYLWPHIARNRRTFLTPFPTAVHSVHPGLFVGAVLIEQGCGLIKTSGRFWMFTTHWTTMWRGRCWSDTHTHSKQTLQILLQQGFRQCGWIGSDEQIWLMLRWKHRLIDKQRERGSTAAMTSCRSPLWKSTVSKMFSWTQLFPVFPEWECVHFQH